TTMAVLTVDTPATQALVLTVQTILATTLLTTQHNHRTQPPVQTTAPHPHHTTTNTSPHISPTRA
ncbi:hypothetical protein, partial [Streptomyces sp. NPDC056244]|uniref:hypothetical protein n=1 Tax=Streptomyces sp. NPDC056244 TaxID=3345762 RepID=UPI0035DEB41C